MKPEQFGIPLPDLDATWTVDVESLRVLMSQHASLICDATPGHAPSVWEALETIEPQDRVSLFTACLACLRQGRPFHELVTIRTHRGRRKRLVLRGARMARASGGFTISGTVSVLQNPVTDPPTVSWELDDLRAQLRDWELLGHALRHELSAPVLAVRGFALALASAEDDLSERGRHHVRRIAAAGSRIDASLDGILHFARLSSSPMRPEFVDMSAIARRTLTDLREAEPDRHVTAHVDSELQAWGDPGLLGLIVRNLLENAWKFTSREPHAKIDFGVESRDLRTVYFVRDNGCGIAPHDANRLFQPFERLHNQDQFEGTGIGLSLVRRAVERHGGVVWIDPAPGPGTCFCFHLPPGP